MTPEEEEARWAGFQYGFRLGRCSQPKDQPAAMKPPEQDIYTVRIEMEFPTEDLKFGDAQKMAEYLLSPVLATLDTLGLTAKQVEMFHSDGSDYAEICKDDVEALNEVGEVGDDDDDDEEP